MPQELLGRRAFLALSATSLLRAQNGKGANFSFPPQAFLDAATEFDLFRLTDPKFSSWLSAPHLHFLSRRGRFLIHSSDRAGTPQIYRLDWHSGESRQLTVAAALERTTPTLSADERSLFYLDGPSLKQLTLGNLRDRELDRLPSGWERAPGFSLSADGTTAIWAEQQNGRFRLRSLQTQRGSATTLAESPNPLSQPQIRPARPQFLFRSNGLLQLGNFTGSAPQSLSTAPDGVIGQALWRPDGRTLLYLFTPSDPKQLISLREYNPDDHTDRLVSKTSQFASFGINSDASVFVGASRSFASPYILLLLRVAHRELTLCEHRSSDPVAVEPVFAPDSQSVFFTSDRRGKRAIYRAHVEKFVEETPEEQQ